MTCDHFIRLALERILLLLMMLTVQLLERWLYVRYLRIHNKHICFLMNLALPILLHNPSGLSPLGFCAKVIIETHIGVGVGRS